MPKKIIADAGVLVAYLLARDEHHEWAVNQFAQHPYMVTCDAALAETCARLAYYGVESARVLRLVVHGSLKIDFDTTTHAARLLRLLEKYGDRPMDFADACIVCMTEQQPDCLVLTVDHEDFSAYRRHGRDVIPFTSPRHA